jgi:hypothetical protein
MKRKRVSARSLLSTGASGETKLRTLRVDR